MKLFERIKERRLELNISQEELAKKIGYRSRSTINKIEQGINDIPQTKIEAFAKALNCTPAYLMGWEEKADTKEKYPAPSITDDYVTFPVIGEIAAGYDNISTEDWSGECIDIPRAYLKGHSQSDFFVLCVKGDSMFPAYQDGDKVLILKCSTLDYSGQIGAVIYDDDYATLKKVEYKYGEDWLKLIPINPSFPPKRVEGEELEHCRVIGVPRLLIREINQ